MHTTMTVDRPTSEVSAMYSYLTPTTGELQPTSQQSTVMTGHQLVQKYDEAV